MKPRVFELIGSFVRGGSERQGLQLSRLLAEDGTFEVFVGCLDRSGPLLDENQWLKQSEVPEFRLGSFYDANFVKQVFRCAAHLRTNRISVIHTHDFYSNIFGTVAGFLARVPVRIASKRETFSKTERQMQLERQSFRLAHRIICNAEAVRDFLIETGVPANKPQVIYNGLDLEPFKTPRPFSSVHPKMELEIHRGRPIITIVANLRSEVKNHAMFLRAATAIAKVHESAQFVIAGEGELTDALKGQAAELRIADRVKFLGACSEVPALLSVSDVCVLSSRSEGFSNAVLEYMAAGKPVVATRVGGAHEAVVEGETGFLVESDDDRSMAQRIMDLLQDPETASKFGQAGRLRVENMFSVGAQLSRTKDLYNEVLSLRGGTNEPVPT